MPETIYFNGRKYNGLTEMPSSERQMYEKFNRFFSDANQDGVPDILQAGGLSSLKEAFGAIKDIAQMSSNTPGMTPAQFSIIRETDRGIYVNGRVFNNVAEMPADIRQVYENITDSAQGGGVDIYDEAWRDVDRADFFKPHDDEVVNQSFSDQPFVSQNSTETVDSNSRFMLIIAAALLIIAGLVFAWIFFF